MSEFRVRSHLGALAAAALVLCATHAAADVQTIETRVIQVKGSEVTLDKGSEDGVAAGQVFDVFRDGEVYFLPLTNGKVPLVRPQERVGRVEVFELEEKTARARIIEGRAAQNQFAYLNPKAQAPNKSPQFVNVDKTVKHVAWPKSIDVVLRNTNEPDEVVRYSWSASGGVLAATITTEPRNTWTAPPTAGEYTIKVTATDAAGQTVPEAILVRSDGIPTSYGPRGMRPTSQTFSAQSRYDSEARDVAFCSAGNARSYVLTERNLIIDEVLAPRRVSKLPDGEFTCVAVSHPRRGQGQVFLLDTESRSVLVYRAPTSSQQPPLNGKPLRIGASGGEGNGHLAQPVDLALSPDGQMVYVLDAAQRCVQVFRTDGRFLLSFGQPGSGPNELHQPTAIAVGPDGRVYVADSDPDRRAIVVYEGFLAMREVPLKRATGKVCGLAVDPYVDVVYALDRATGRVMSFNTTGSFDARSAYAPAAGFHGELKRPLRLRADRVGRVWAVDRDGASVAQLNPRNSGGQWFERRTGGVEISDMLRIAASPDGGVAVLDDNQVVTCFDAQGWIVTQFGGAGDGKGKFDSATDLVVSAQGEVFVLDSGRQLLNRFSRTGVPFAPPLSNIRQAVDLSPLSDRSGIAVLTQGGSDAFILVNSSGKTILKSQQYDGDLTPPRGCVTVDKSKNYVFWTADDDEEKVYRAPMDQNPIELGHSFNQVTLGSDVIGDMEPTVYGWVFISDRDEEKLVVFDQKGTLRWEKIYGDPLRGLADIGTDDFGFLYALDTKRNHVLKLSPQR